MELLWLWAFSLKTPLSIICGVSIFACFLSWLSAKSQRGEQNLTMIHIGIVIAIVWSIVYAIPAPHYNVHDVVKEVPKPYPVIRTIRYVAQKQVLTRTITMGSTMDEKFNECEEFFKHHTDPDAGVLPYCRDWAKSYMEPRVVTKEVKVPVPSGVQIKIEHDPFLKLFQACNDIGTIAAGDAVGANIRNQRLAICKDVALAGSR